MPTDPTGKPPSQSRRLSLLWCRACGRMLQRTPADMLQYTTSGWPSCCGQVMELFVQTDRPGSAGSADTALDRPVLPSSGDTGIDKAPLPPEETDGLK
jgi:hypothetical protein